MSESSMAEAARYEVYICCQCANAASEFFKQFVRHTRISSSRNEEKSESEVWVGKRRRNSGNSS